MGMIKLAKNLALTLVLSASLIQSVLANGVELEREESLYSI